MAVGHLPKKAPRAFKPNGYGGGSKPGKVQNRWPWVGKIVMDAITIRAKGSIDAMIRDRRCPFSMEEFEAIVETTMPGIWEYLATTMKATQDRIGDGYNRVYKMYYSGDSDRGPDHDPWTRACMSREHWHYRFGANHPLAELHERVLTGREPVVLNWKEYL